MFDKYVNLIRSKAWYYAKKYHIDYEEVVAQGYLIYCQCLQDFDVSKSGFSTHLYIELNRLKDFCYTYNRQKGILLDDETDEQNNSISEKTMTSNYETVSQESILEFAKNNLSLDAYSLFSWIISRAWENFHKTKPAFTDMKKHFNDWKNSRLKNAYEEIKYFWDSELKFAF